MTTSSPRPTIVEVAKGTASSSLGGSKAGTRSGTRPSIASSFAGSSGGKKENTASTLSALSRPHHPEVSNPRTRR
ncbi:hypothetical protein AVW09_00920 [Microbacterium sp. T32]|nr:hypothetical protein AVW09_00920 [Microbacterium sp. T32]